MNNFLNNNYRVLYWIARGKRYCEQTKENGCRILLQAVCFVGTNQQKRSKVHGCVQCVEYPQQETNIKQKVNDDIWWWVLKVRGTSNLPRYSASSNWRTIGAKGWESTPKNSTNNLRAWNSPSSQSHSTAILDWTNCEIHSPPKAIKHPQLASAKPKHLGHLHSNLFMDCRPTRAPRSTPSLRLMCTHRKDGENGRMCRKPSKPSFCVRKFARIHFWQVWACPTVGLGRRKMCPNGRGCVKCLTRCWVRSNLLSGSWRRTFLSCPIARRKTGGFCCVDTYIGLRKSFFDEV